MRQKGLDPFLFKFSVEKGSFEALLGKSWGGPLQVGPGPNLRQKSIDPFLFKFSVEKGSFEALLGKSWGGPLQGGPGPA